MNSLLSWIARSQGKKRLVPAILCLLTLSIIGVIDYAIDYRISLIVLYILPIAFATLYVGTVFAIILAILSVVIWMAGDYWAGAPYPGTAIEFWNGGIVLSLFIIVVLLLDALRRALLGLEAKVAERTKALHQEMEERHRLEHEILDLSERERQSFGQELHDVICQELAGIAIAGQVLSQKLQAKEIEESKDAQEISEMIYRSLGKARTMARGFFTEGFDVVGLADALREILVHVEERSGIRCTFQWQEDLSISNEDVVMHFFRIAQEAVQNALKHAGATQIRVSLENKDRTVQLIIEDNGKGFPSLAKSKNGLGLRIMAYRTELIGGKLNAERVPTGGTRITCVVPAEQTISKPS